MQKIKSLLGGHKKDEEATHAAQTTSTETHQEGQSHPIYNQMSGTDAQPTTAETSTGLGHGEHSTPATGTSTGLAGTSTGLGHTEHSDTGGPLGSHSTATGGPSAGLGHTAHTGTGGPLGNNVTSDTSRPGAGVMHEGMSTASIKSGVIGFGTSERQEHAALPSHHNPEANLDRNQVVGGGSMGNSPATTNTSTGDQPSTLKQALPLAGNSTGDQPYSSTTQSSATRQPFDQSLRQESYTNDTDRSFPLAGGIAPKHDAAATHATEHQTSAIHNPTQHHTSTTHHATEQLTPATHHPTEHTSSTHHPITSEREPGTKEREVEARDGHGREGLAGAAAAATAIGVAAPLSQSHHRDVPSHGQDLSSAAHSNQPLGATSTGPTSGIAGNTTHDAHYEALAAARAAAAKSSNTSSSTHGHGVGTDDGSFGNTSRAVDPSSSIPQSHGAGVLGSEPLRDTSFAGNSRRPEASASTSQPHGTEGMDPGRPPGGRSISYRHVPGGYPSATPDESKTFLFYRDNVVPEPGVDAPGYTATKGQYCHPESDEHLRRAGSSAGGVAGSHAPHSHDHGDTIGSASSTAGPHNSNILNKLDPRVDSDLDGSKTAKGGPSSQHGAEHAGSAPLATGTSTSVLPGQHGGSHTTHAPVVPGASSDVPSNQHELRHTGSLEQPMPRSSDLSEDHHHGRDAAIVGGLGAGAAGLGYAATQNRDTPHAGGNNLTHESSPYSSKQLDPRVLGSKANLEEQRYDPQVSSQAAPHHGVSSTGEHHSDTVGSESSSGAHHKSSLLNKLDPRVKTGSSKASEDTSATGVSSASTTTKHEEPQSHYARDAALVGGGAATAGGIHHELHRNDTAGTGTAVLPEEHSARTTGPLSSSTTSGPLTSSAPVQSSHSSAPLSSSTTSASHPTIGTTDTTHSGKSDFEAYQGPKTTSGSPFYGAVGAPAPLVDDSSSHSHQPVSTSSTTAPVSQQQDVQHHHGRDATLGGAGLATAGGLAYAGHHDSKTETGPASNTLGPHSSNAANILDPRVQPDPSKQIHHNIGSTAEDPASRTIGHHQSNVANILDPRVQPDPAKQKAHVTSGPHQSDTLNHLDPKVDEKAGHNDHHIGRDAAVVGGTGAAGYGAYEAAQAYGDHRSTQPGASMIDQRYDPSAAGAHASNPVPAAGHYDYNNDHTSRNAALGTGAALGAGGLGYAGLKHADNTSQIPASSTQPLSSSAGSAPLTQSHPTHDTAGQRTLDPASTTYPAQGTIAPQNTHSTVPGSTQSPYGSNQDPRAQDHSKRDAALLGTAGAAAAGGAYAHSKDHDAERLEKEQQERLKKEQHDREKEQHKLDKEHSKQEKESHKLEKEQHKHDKAIVAAEKHDHKHEKEQEKEAHRLQKEREKEAARLEKEREKEAEPAEKKHGILGFLHRDKSKKDKTSADNSPRQSGEVRRSIDNKRHSKEYAAGGAALGAGAGLGAATTAAAYDDDSNPNSPRWKGKNRLHKDPPAGHPAREALEHHEMGEMHGGKREHVGVDGPIGNPNAISGTQETRHNTYGAVPLNEITEHHKVVEPRTGLPMNVERYGDGHGGTDASPTIHGYHQVPGAHDNFGTEHRPTDHEAIKKADTPY